MSKYGQDYGQDVNVPFNPDESVFDPTYGGSLPVYLPTDDDFVPTVRSGGASRGIGGGAANNRSDLTNTINNLFGSNLSGKDIAARAAVLGGGLAGGLGAFSSGTQKVGYQGGIPKFTAERNMVTAPPAGSRPGAGGVNYGGDVNYVRQPGSPSTSSGGAGGSSTLGNIAKVAGGAGLAALLANYLGKSGGSGDIASILKRIGGGSSGGLEKMPDATAGGSGELTTPAGEYYGEDEFTGIDERIRANENELQPPPMLSDEEVQDELFRLATENDYNYYPDYNDTPIEMAKGGGVPRYLQGETDGMADKIPARIGKDQPAALSHGEFVVPADVVSHLGNGNSDAGAKKLYSMMDKIREARTGTKKQGKKINPDSFMPGGLAQAYANGGSVKHFAVGGTMPAGTTGSEQTLASWTGDYIPNMLGKAEALASAPYQQYGGPLTAGASDLQQQAFKAGSNLSVPGSVGTAAQTAGDIASKAQNISYSPSGAPQYDKLSAQNVSSSFQAPEAYKAGTFENQFKAPEISAATQFTNQFKAPDPYQSTAFKSGTFGQEQAQQYMNPYLQSSLNPQLEEARRQSNISEQANKAAMTKAGAFGGGRSAILTAENQRNLGSNLANITGKGYDTAFQNAMSQFNQDQARNMQAQQASEQSKQFGAQQGMTAADMQAKYGMSAQQAQEAARQFNQGQSMTAADMQAKYGLSAQQAQEASRQFGANQALQSATTAGSQGLQAAMANQQAGLTAGQGNINAAMEAARQQEQSRQFGANLGLQGLQTGLQAAKTQGDLGISSGQLGLAQLQQQAALGAQQRGIEAEGIAADKAAFEQARENPYKMLQFQQSMLQGLPISATNYSLPEQDWLTKAAGGATTTAKLLETLGLGGSSSPKK